MLCLSRFPGQSFTIQRGDETALVVYDEAVKDRLATLARVRVVSRFDLRETVMSIGEYVTILPSVLMWYVRSGQPARFRFSAADDVMIYRTEILEKTKAQQDLRTRGDAK